MEYRRAYSFKHWLRVSALIICCLPIYSNAQAMQVSSISFETGLGGSLLYTSADDGHFGIGSGYQYLLHSKWNIGKDWSLKLGFESLTLEQELLSNASLSNTEAISHLQQQWYLLQVGMEWEKDFWFYEYFSGLSIGRDSAIGIDEENLGHSQRIYISDKTLSSIFFGASVGYRKDLYKNWNLISRIKTFFFLQSVYKDGSDYYGVLPLQFSIGVERLF